MNKVDIKNEKTLKERLKEIRKKTVTSLAIMTVLNPLFPSAVSAQNSNENVKDEILSSYSQQFDTSNKIENLKGESNGRFILYPSPLCPDDSNNISLNEPSGSYPKISYPKNGNIILFKDSVVILWPVVQGAQMYNIKVTDKSDGKVVISGSTTDNWFVIPIQSGSTFEVTVEAVESECNRVILKETVVNIPTYFNKK